MTRSVWKGPFVEEYVIKKAEKALASKDNKPLKIWSRRSTILPKFIGLVFSIYNGKSFLPLHVTEDMVGHKFGEFAPTRVFRGHSGKKK